MLWKITLWKFMLGLHNLLFLLSYPSTWVVQLKITKSSQKHSRYSIYFFFRTSQTEKDYDFLTIYDEANDYYNPIKKLSGNFKGFGISSSGNVMHLKFESDGNTIDNGFLATFYYGTKIDFLVKLPQIHDILFF